MNRMKYSPDSYRKIMFLFFVLILIYACILTTSAESVVSISPSSQSIGANQEFDVYINIDPETPIAGAQLDILYDPDMLSVSSVNEGDFFKQDGTMSIFIGGTVDDSQGRVNGLFAVTLGKAEISTEGTFAHITFIASDTKGDCVIDISNVILSNSDGLSVPVTTHTAQVTINENTPSSPIDETTASSGGGGGGGGDTGEDANNIALKEVKKIYIIADTDIIYSFDENSNPISSINYRSLKNAGFITSTIEVLKDVSSTVSEKPEGLIYRNMNIWIGKAGYATGTNMDDMRISFVVLKNWITVNDVDPENIHLKRYHAGKWETLDTEIKGENEDFIIFEAKTPGFSPFAITAEAPSYIMEDEVLLNEESDSKITDQEEENSISIDNSVSGSTETSSAKLAQNSSLLFCTSMLIILFLRRGKLI
ncbi:PGF-pre-PGF domain-containing protein [Methanolobus mangrovi]|uniref:PGF-pre-PGF domain-containing protein n=1 Tax=Methanolobus mangrovi TaxID=3072977 RepID=A0AA51YHG2_9EURY|nr:PGF-pre-PGF domain-containing protein [Methanolobus mangrovi]WMW23131.1 PGF-pre-PGF domain-containing protein [Methanolobus mangrovi]